MKSIVFATIGLLCATAASLVGGSYAYTEHRMNRQWEVPTPKVTVSTEADVIERGRHLVQHVVLCTNCHDSDLGGRDPFIALPGVAVVNAANLTPGPGSAVADYTPDDLGRLVRYGVRPDGTAVTGMTVNNFTGISDADLDAVVSYLVQVDPVDRRPPPTSFALPGRIAWTLGAFELQFSTLVDLDAQPPARTPNDPTALGAYLFDLSGCRDCHGETASGGAHPLAPPDNAIPRNLTPHETGLADWSVDDFDRAVRGGMSKDGTPLDRLMPYGRYGGMERAEVEALWAYVRTLEPRPFGNR